MPVLRQVPRSEVTDETVTAYYNRLFGDRDPVAEPGTATGTPGDWWNTPRPAIFSRIRCIPTRRACSAPRPMPDPENSTACRPFRAVCLHCAQCRGAVPFTPAATRPCPFAVKKCLRPLPCASSITRPAGCTRTPRKQGPRLAEVVATGVGGRSWRPELATGVGEC